MNDLMAIANRLGAGGGLAAGLWWMLGHRGEALCLNYLELSGVVLLVVYWLEQNRKVKTE